MRYFSCFCVGDFTPLFPLLWPLVTRLTSRSGFRVWLCLFPSFLPLSGRPEFLVNYAQKIERSFHICSMWGFLSFHYVSFMRFVIFSFLLDNAIVAILAIAFVFVPTSIVLSFVIRCFFPCVSAGADLFYGVLLFRALALCVSLGYQYFNLGWNSLVSSA